MLHRYRKKSTSGDYPVMHGRGHHKSDAKTRRDSRKVLRIICFLCHTAEHDIGDNAHKHRAYAYHQRAPAALPDAHSHKRGKTDKLIAVYGSWFSLFSRNGSVVRLYVAVEEIQQFKCIVRHLIPL